MRNLVKKLVGSILLSGSALIAASAQSSSQEYPTPILSNELSGTIKARDIGDSRLTTYYFVFNGEQGDVFINLVTRNLTGDFDVFTAAGLKPLTKIVVYADLSENETGRVIYLRKPERLLLRIQGRTPNDDPASFRLKFAGSFAALRPDDVPSGPELPKVDNQGVARVNSVGTLLPPPPKPVEPIVAEKAKVETEISARTEPTPEPKPTDTDISTVPEEKTAKSITPEEKTDRETKVIVSDPLATVEKTEAPARRRTTPVGRRTPARGTSAKPKPVEPVATKVAEPDDPLGSKAADKKAETTTTALEEKALPVEKSASDLSSSVEAQQAVDEKEPSETPAKAPPSRRTGGRKLPAPPKRPVEEPKPDPLASINLVILFKDGDSIEKPMNEVLRFSVDKGILTVSLKDGSTSRYKIIEVEKVTIQ